MPTLTPVNHTMRHITVVTMVDLTPRAHAAARAGKGGDRSLLCKLRIIYLTRRLGDAYSSSRMVHLQR